MFSNIKIKHIKNQNPNIQNPKSQKGKIPNPKSKNMVITLSSERDRATGESALYKWTAHHAAHLMGGVEEAACFVFWLCFSRLQH